MYYALRKVASSPQAEAEGKCLKPKGRANVELWRINPRSRADSISGHIAATQFGARCMKRGASLSNSYRSILGAADHLRYIWHIATEVDLGSVEGYGPLIEAVHYTGL